MQNRYPYLILTGVTLIASPVAAETVIYGRLQSNQAYSDAAVKHRFSLKDPRQLGEGLNNLFELEWQVDGSDFLGSGNPSYQEWRELIDRQGPLGYKDPSQTDIWDLAIGYRHGPLTIGTSFLNYQQNGLEQRELWGASTRYRISDFALTAQYEYDRERDADKSHEWALVGEYYLGNSVLRARYADRDWDDDTNHQWSFGLRHQFNKRTSFYAEFQDNQTETEQLYGAGIRHDF